MNIHEYQAKRVLASYGIPVTDGVEILSADAIDSTLDAFKNVVEKGGNPYVVKAQIHAGGRGKGGGVKIAKTLDEAKKYAHDMFGMNLVTQQTGPAGQKVRRLYIEKGCNIVKELYLSAILDRASAAVTFIASTEGGMDIEEVSHKTPEKIHKVSINVVAGFQMFYARNLAFALKLDKALHSQFYKIVEGIYKAIVEKDIMQLEINPLAIVSIKGDDGVAKDSILALDAKVVFDDNALFRHKDVSDMRDEAEEDPLETRALNTGLNYVKMNGAIGCMVNGAGLAMATMDIIQLHGGTPANFLDVGGGADKAKVTEAFKIILSDPNVKAILVNIFGGIMKCDIIANGIVAAAQEVSIGVPLVVRLAGTNVDLGKQILKESGLDIKSADNLEEAAQMVVSAVA